MQDFFRKVVRNKIIMAVMSILFGILLIMAQSQAVEFIVRFAGWILLIAAAVFCIMYFTGGEVRDPGRLVSAAITLLFGIILVNTPQIIVNFFPVLLGIVLIISSITNIAGLLSSLIRGPFWITSLMLAFVSLVLGVVVLMNPTAFADFIILFTGFTFIVNGITDLLLISVFRNTEE
jgi:uncharacterized membrane protein HdeD (DUF308 family)